jgi:hypothetical protein
MGDDWFDAKSQRAFGQSRPVGDDDQIAGDAEDADKPAYPETGDSATEAPDGEAYRSADSAARAAAGASAGGYTTGGSFPAWLLDQGLTPASGVAIPSDTDAAGADADAAATAVQPAQGARRPSAGPRIGRRSEPRGQRVDASGDFFAVPITQAQLGEQSIAASAIHVGGYQRVAAGQQQQRSAGSRRQDRRTRVIAVGMGILAAILICACAALLLDPDFQRAGFPFGVGERSATETAYAASSTPGNYTPAALTPTNPNGQQPTPGGPGGSPPTATAVNTPTPLPNGATVSFFVSSKQISSPGAMTACASGCDLPGAAYSNSQNFTSGQIQSTQIPQTGLDGAVTVTNNSSATWAEPAGYGFTGGGYTCASVNSISLPAGTSHSYSCSVSASSPSEIGANVINGTTDGGQVTYNNPAPLVGNGGWQVTNSDCQNAYGILEQQDGVPWGTSWVQSQLPAGWNFSLSSPQFSVSNQQCPQGQDIQNFTVTITTTVVDGGWNPTPAAGVAASRLQGQVPSGYVIKSGTSTTCSPALQGYNSGSGVTSVKCSDSAMVIYNWTSSLKQNLAVSLEGQTQSAATATCNATTGVTSGSCTISIMNGYTSMPTDPGSIHINANIP